MSTPILIDSLSFARDRQSRSGRIALAKLARVVEELAATDGELVWSLQGDIDTLSRPFALANSNRTDLALPTLSRNHAVLA